MKKLSLILGMTLTASLAYAQGTTSTSTSNTSTLEKSQVIPKDAERKDIDDEITNAKLRAETGSKSKYSFRSSFGVSGGTFARPFGDVRPDLLGDPDSINETSVGGSLGMKYRMTDRDNLSLSTGVSLKKPFTTSSSEVANKINVSGLSLSYDRLYKAGGLQMVSGMSVGVETDRDYIDKNNSLGSLGFSQTAISSSASGWDFGASANAKVSLYRGDIREGSKDGRNTSVVLGVYPFAEYGLSEKLTLRTLVGFMSYSDRDNSSTFNMLSVYQSVGLGISPTRDIYFYPNFQFNPENISSDRTNVALTMYINL